MSGLALGIVLVAAFLRLYRIDSLPPAAGYDQAAYGLDALEIVDGARPVFLPSNFGREALFSYLVALVYLVLGDAALSVYVTSALVGVLTVPAVSSTDAARLTGTPGASHSNVHGLLHGPHTPVASRARTRQ